MITTKNNKDRLREELHDTRKEIADIEKRTQLKLLELAELEYANKVDILETERKTKQKLYEAAALDVEIKKYQLEQMKRNK